MITVDHDRQNKTGYCSSHPQHSRDFDQQDLRMFQGNGLKQQCLTTLHSSLFAAVYLAGIGQLSTVTKKFTRSKEHIENDKGNGVILNPQTSGGTMCLEWEEKCDKERVDSALKTGAEKLQSEWNEEELARQKREEENIVQQYIRFVIDKRLPVVKNYKFGDMIGAEEFKNNGLDISEIKSARIVVFGPTGSGKSSFIAMAQHIMLEKPFNAVETQSAGGEGNRHLEKYLHDMNFHLLDTRGYFDTGEDFSLELQNILSGRLKDDEEIDREGDIAMRISKLEEGKLSEKGHCLIAILDIDDARFDQYKSEMEKYRKFFKEKGFSPVSVVTYKTKGVPDEQSKMKKTMEAASIFGAAIDRSFILRNHIADGDKTVIDESKVTVTRILETALIGAEMYIKIQMLQAAGGEGDEENSSK
ncbi:uncharacterized protein [Ptychodera flava]|uniref:uncharacterized protein n=1 Tax=Ptychodera flava TaxID=63121 RepID=UPI00396A22CD